MAKSSWKERNKKKQRIVAKYAELRAELRSKRDYAGLAQLPRNASPTRVVNRCKITGRRHGYFRKFGVSRLTFRGNGSPRIDSRGHQSQLVKKE